VDILASAHFRACCVHSCLFQIALHCVPKFVAAVSSLLLLAAVVRLQSHGLHPTDFFRGCLELALAATASNEKVPPKRAAPEEMRSRSGKATSQKTKRMWCLSRAVRLYLSTFARVARASEIAISNTHKKV
jgi:hypothetical protein